MTRARSRRIRRQRRKMRAETARALEFKQACDELLAKMRTRAFMAAMPYHLAFIEAQEEMR